MDTMTYENGTFGPPNVTGFHNPVNLFTTHLTAGLARQHFECIGVGVNNSRADAASQLNEVTGDTNHGHQGDHNNDHGGDNHKEGLRGFESH